MLNLYAKAALCAFKPSKSDIVLPQKQLFNHICLDNDLVAQYNAITGWEDGSASLFLHPLYVQVLSLPMQLRMMVDKTFPFKPIGLVHLANAVTIEHLPSVGQDIDVVCYCGKVYRHKRGVVFSVVTEAKRQGQTMVKASSYYLSRQGSDATIHNSDLSIFNEGLFIQSEAFDDAQRSSEIVDKFYFGHDAGRKYAKVSGDYNPIHLWPVTANLFGFKQAIAHGMLTKAQVISALFKRDEELLQRINNEGKAEIKAVFKAPVMLPNQCDLQMKTSGEDISMQLVSKGKKRDKVHIDVTFAMLN